MYQQWGDQSNIQYICILISNLQTTNMSKKEQNNKNNKALSKNSGKSRDRNIYSYKQLPETRDITQISFLEKRLNEQISTREQSYAQLLQMIRILDQTKKSKVPANFQKLSSKKLLSPNRHATLQNQDLNQIKAQIAQIHSLKQLDEQQSKNKIHQIQRQIRSIKNKFQQLEGIKVNLLHFNQQLNHFKSQVFDIHQKLQQQLQIQNRSNMVEVLYQKINNQYMLMKTLSTQLSKMESNVGTVQNNVKYMSSSLNQIQKSMENQFAKIQYNINKTSETIIETKNNLEEIFYGKSKADGKKSSNHGRELELSQRLSHTQSRVLGLQRRMDLIYHQYLSMPIKHKV